MYINMCMCERVEFTKKLKGLSSCFHLKINSKKSCTVLIALLHLLFYSYLSHNTRNDSWLKAHRGRRRSDPRSPPPRPPTGWNKWPEHSYGFMEQWVRTNHISKHPLTVLFIITHWNIAQNQNKKKRTMLADQEHHDPVCVGNGKNVNKQTFTPKSQRKAKPVCTISN